MHANAALQPTDIKVQQGVLIVHRDYHFKTRKGFPVGGLHQGDMHHGDAYGEIFLIKYISTKQTRTRGNIGYCKSD